MLVALLVVLAVVMMVAISIGAVSVPLSDVWRIVLRHLAGGGEAGDPALDQIVWNFRTPRVVLAALVGAGLAVSGVVLQAVVANPLADPYIVGVSSGASLGAVLVITLTSGALGGLGVSSAAFVGAVGAVVLVFLLGHRGGRLAPTRLVLSGVAVGYLFLAATSYLQLQATPTELRTVMFWMLGSVAGAQWGQLTIVSIVVLTTTVALSLFGRQLNALLAGDESCRRPAPHRGRSEACRVPSSRLCVSASLRLCVSASLRLCGRGGVRVGTGDGEEPGPVCGRPRPLQPSKRYPMPGSVMR